jgi:hypothetical protein
MLLRKPKKLNPGIIHYGKDNSSRIFYGRLMAQKGWFANGTDYDERSNLKRTLN